MSRQNKVNPGMYTQRGRLTQDDAARELRKQSAIGSPHTWQPVNTKRRPSLAPAGEAARDTETSAGNEEASPQAETRPASRVTRNITATKAAPSTAKAKAATVKTARTRKSKRTTANARTGKPMATAMKRTTTKPTRKAVLARNVSGGRAAPRPSTKRRKS